MNVDTIEELKPGVFLTLPSGFEFVPIPEPSLRSRRGWFRVSSELLRLHMEDIAPLMACLVVTDVVHNFSNATVDYFACSDLFEEIPNEVAAIEYEIEFVTSGASQKQISLSKAWENGQRRLRRSEVTYAR